MKLTYYRGAVPNFGDELNSLVWPQLLPAGFLDNDPAELFIGIGSILFNDYPRQTMKHVLGFGYAGYTQAPDLGDGSWNVVFVRGPRTAARFGLPAEKSIGDSAILLRTLDLPAVDKMPIEIGFMPHYRSLDRGFWQDACSVADIRLIDPTQGVETVLTQLRATKLLITEAMHGAIVADAMRVPWVAATPINPIDRAKWQDWSGSLSLSVRQHALAPSSVLEAWMGMTDGRGDTQGRVGRISRSSAARPVNHWLTHRAARRLQNLARQEPQLSADAELERVTDRMLSAVQSFVRVHGNAAKLDSRPVIRHAAG